MGEAGHRAALARLLALERKVARVQPSGAMRGRSADELRRRDAQSAVALLAEAVERNPRDAGSWNDLAAARLERALVEADSYENFLAWMAAERALRLAPELLAARFNRARALTRVALYDQARDEWTLYLRDETDEAWAAQARRHLEALPEGAESKTWDELSRSFEAALALADRAAMDAVISRCPRCFREHGEQRLLPEWARAVRAGRAFEAERALSQAKAIGEHLARVRAEPVLASTVAEIELLTGPGRDRMAQALYSYGEGIELATKGRFQDALPILAHAKEELVSFRSPLLGWVEYRIALCHYQHEEYSLAASQLLAVVRAAGEEGHRALRGRALHLLALIRQVEGDPVAALSFLDPALREMQALGETSYVAKLQTLVGYSLEQLGRREEAWRAVSAALAEHARGADTSERAATYLLGAKLAITEREAEVALVFQDEVVRLARANEAPSALVEALRGRAGIATAAGRLDAAERDLAEAKAALATVADARQRQSIVGDLLLVAGRLAFERSPREALDEFDQAIPILRESSYQYRLVDALHERSRALMALGRIDEAERDLEEAIAESERQRGLVDSPADRVTSFDRRREIFDDMIRLELDGRKRPDLALAFAEAARARVLKDWLAAGPHAGAAAEGDAAATGVPRVAGWYRRLLPSSGLLVAYAVLPEKTVIWALRKGEELAVAEVEISADALRERVEGLCSALSRGSLERAAELHQLLIRPIAHLLRPGEHLAFLPDGPLHSLPFALLRDGSRGRLLLEDHPSSVAPSLRVLAAGERRRETQVRRGPPKALIVASPAFDRELHPDLAPLAAGGAEAEIGLLFPGSEVLAGEGATRRAFLERAARFEILHFGGHSLVNADAPLFSQLLFAPERDDPSRGALYSGDLLRLRFPRTALVTLASCRSGAGKISRTEGVESLVRPFLAAGVPSVIAALWDVEDRATASFFLRFYQHLAGAGDVATALRATQLEALAGPEGRDPSSWGAFELVGAR